MAVPFSPPEYPARTCTTPLTCWKTPWTPQKQPPERTAVCGSPAAFGWSSAGAGSAMAASSAREPDCHSAAAAPASSTAATTALRTERGSLENLRSGLDDMDRFLGQRGGDPSRPPPERRSGRISAATSADYPIVSAHLKSTRRDRIVSPLRPTLAPAGLSFRPDIVNRK